MKKSLSLLLTLVLCCALTACGDGQGAADSGVSSGPTASQPDEAVNSTQLQDTSDTSNPADIPETPESEGGSGSGVLIAYFTYGENAPLAEGVDASASIQLRGDGSLTGNTGLVADMIAEATGGELFSILTAEQYPDNYDGTIDAGQEEKAANVRPELSLHLDSLDGYDTVFLGFPNWWGDMPMAIYSFLDEYDLSGKTIVPFCTSGGSGIANSVSNIRELADGAAWLEGRRFSGGASHNAIADWVNSLALPEKRL